MKRMFNHVNNYTYMTLKDKILTDLSGIKNPNLLNQIFEFIQLIKEDYASNQESNKEMVLNFAGEISDEEGKKINEIINEEFNKIEGDW